MRLVRVTRGGNGQTRRHGRAEPPRGRGQSTYQRNAAGQKTRQGRSVATERRRDLQGVREVAGLLVAVNHAQVPFLPGGYVGVDVFFVLSGYFITGLLPREGIGGEHGRDGD